MMTRPYPTKNSIITTCNDDEAISDKMFYDNYKCTYNDDEAISDKRFYNNYLQ